MHVLGAHHRTSPSFDFAARNLSCWHVASCLHPSMCFPSYPLFFFSWKLPRQLTEENIWMHCTMDIPVDRSVNLYTLWIQMKGWSEIWSLSWVKSLHIWLLQHGNWSWCYSFLVCSYHDDPELWCLVHLWMKKYVIKQACLYFSFLHLKLSSCVAYIICMVRLYQKARAYDINTGLHVREWIWSS